MRKFVKGLGGAVAVIYLVLGALIGISNGSSGGDFVNDMLTGPINQGVSQIDVSAIVARFQ